MRDPKRAVRRALAVLAGLACAAAAACNAILDNGTSTYVAPDVHVAESGVGDALSADGFAGPDAFVSWCARHEANALVCVDFDEPGWTIGAGYLYPPNGPPPLPAAGGGTMSLSDAAVSAPFSFEASREAGPTFSAHFSYSPLFGAPTKHLPAQVTLTFDLSVVSDCKASFLARVGAVLDTARTFSLGVLVTNTTGPELRLYAENAVPVSGGPMAQLFVAQASALPLPDAGFARVTLTIQYGQSVDLSVVAEGAADDASVQHATASLTDAASWVDAAIPPMLPPDAAITSDTFVDFGALQQAQGIAGFAGACVVRMDNVWSSLPSDGG